MGFSRQEYWSGLPCSPPRDLPAAGIEPASLTFPALAELLPLAPHGTPVDTYMCVTRLSDRCEHVIHACVHEHPCTSTVNPLLLAPPAPASMSDPCLSICPVCPCAYMWLLRVQAPCVNSAPHWQTPRHGCAEGPQGTCVPRAVPTHM